MAFLSLALRDNPDALAVDDETRRLTFRDLAREAEWTARRLGGLGVGPGDAVALKGDLDATLLAAFHGVLMVGGIVAPIHSRWGAAEEGRARAVLEPRIVLTSETLHSTLGPATPTPPGSLPRWKPDDPVAHLLTSGTSGQPRTVVLSLGNLLASARGVAERLALTSSDRWLGSLSAAHVGGLSVVTRAAALGSALILRGPFSAQGFTSLLSQGTVTHASLVPTMLRRVMDEWSGGPAPESLRCLLIGGAPAPQELVQEALDRGFPLALTYGLTEASSQVATAPPDLVVAKPGTVGAPLPGVQVRISDTGELTVKGPTVATGQAGEDGWLRTGDLAREDESGHLWITGRVSDRIISGGESVTPGEVEAVLKAHPQVLDAVVVGIPDREWGERVVAAVVRGPQGAPAPEDLDRIIREELAPAKRPKEYRFVGSLPLNPNGKTDREGVRNLFQ